MLPFQLLRRKRTKNVMHPKIDNCIGQKKKKPEEKNGRDHNDGRSGHFPSARPGNVVQLLPREL
jgi:hypothetical protein